MTPYLVLIRKFWWIGPVIAAGILFAMWRGAEREADRYQQQVKAEQSAHAITRASVTTLQAAIDADNAEDIAAGEAYQDARTQAAIADARADAQFGATQAAIGALRASVGRNGEGCNVPVEVRNALR